ncbi:MAG: adenylate kinase, partial [Candidatus ainarchaeum sp.]|nr:adenylate kinase [Candidatus ainarchaeum sp.]
TPSGYFPGLPFQLLGKLKVDRLVLLSATVDEIFNRRKNDPTRSRNANREEIVEHDQMNRAYLAAYSAFTGAPATIIMNHDNRVGEAVAALAAVLE